MLSSKALAGAEGRVAALASCPRLLLAGPDALAEVSDAPVVLPLAMGGCGR